MDSRIVLPHGSPLPLRCVGSKLLPVLDTVTILSQPLLLGTEHFLLVDNDHFAGADRKLSRECCGGCCNTTARVARAADLLLELCRSGEGGKCRGKGRMNAVDTPKTMRSSYCTSDAMRPKCAVRDGRCMCTKDAICLEIEAMPSVDQRRSKSSCKSHEQATKVLSAVHHELLATPTSIPSNAPALLPV